MDTTMELSASLEDYLETIFHLVAEKQTARARDIAKRLKVGRSSVTGALHALAEKGLVNYAPYEVITLTRRGEAAAREVVRRHEVLRDFLVKVLSIDERAADEGACQMEHAIPPPVFERLMEFIEFVEVCPRAGAKWIRGFGYHCEHGKPDDCKRCIAACLQDVTKRESDAGRKAAMTIALRELSPGQKARIERIKGRGETNKRLVEMGLTPGSVVEMGRVAPLGDPIEIKVKGYHLSLRKEEAEKVTVTLL